MKQNEVAKMLAVMARLMPGGERIDETSADFLMLTLEEYQSGQVLAALKRCFKELKFFPTISEIVERIDDGRPGAEEAWSMAPKGDSDAAYLNNEIILAWSAAAELLKHGNEMVAARMVFKEIYDKTVKENRAKGIKPKWWLSRACGRGSDLINEAVLRDAIEKKRISVPNAIALLPSFTPSSEQLDQLPQAKEVHALISSTFKQMEK